MPLVNADSATMKTLVAFLLLATAVTLSGCGGSPSSSSPQPAIASGVQPEPIAPVPAPAPAAPVGVTLPADFFGMHIQCVVAPCSTGTVPYPTSLKFATVRLWDSAYWSLIEPGRDVYNWTELDSLTGIASANGVASFVFSFGNPPAWALNPDGSVNQQDADDFLNVFVRRECGTIQYYETWNEANLPSAWTGTQAQLVTLAQHFYTIVKANCPSAKVLTPSVNTITDTDSRQWLINWLNQGVPYDIIAFHGYTQQPEAVQQDMQWLRSVVGLKVEVWDTEGSWGHEGSLTEAQEANWLMRTYIMQAASGVSRFYWYAYGSTTWGTLYNRQAATAYETVSGWLTGATINDCSSDVAQNWTCTITRSDSTRATITWNAAQPDSTPILR